MSVLHLDEYKKELKGFDELKDGCKEKERPIAAFQSLGRNLDYCKYHYDQYETNYACFSSSYRSKKKRDDGSCERFRIAFESNAFAFFRSLHSWAESISYLLYTVLDDDPKNREQNIYWSSVSKKCPELKEDIVRLTKSKEYKSLEAIVNKSKHRFLPRINAHALIKGPTFFYEEDFDDKLVTYDVKELMEKFWELTPRFLELIKLCLKINRTS